MLRFLAAMILLETAYLTGLFVWQPIGPGGGNAVLAIVLPIAMAFTAAYFLKVAPESGGRRVAFYGGVVAGPIVAAVLTSFVLYAACNLGSVCLEY